MKPLVNLVTGIFFLREVGLFLFCIASFQDAAYVTDNMGMRVRPGHPEHVFGVVAVRVGFRISEKMIIGQTDRWKKR